MFIMKSTIFLILFGHFFVANVHGGNHLKSYVPRGICFEGSNLKRGDIVHVQLSDNSTEHYFVIKDGRSPNKFGKIIEVFSHTDKDYPANVERIFGEIIPAWVNAILFEHEKQVYEREKKKNVEKNKEEKINQ